MKKIVLSLFAIATLIACEKECDECENKDCEISTDSTLVCKTNLSSGLLAYYPFNGNYNDESGNGNTATTKNGAYLTSDLYGRTSSCAGFDGLDDYLIVPANSKLNADTISLSVQVMVNSVNRSQAVFSRTNFETATATSMGVGVPLPSDNWAFTVVSNTQDCSVQHGYTTAGTLFANNAIQPGRWYNIITVFAGGVQKLYINGVLQNSATRSWTKMKQCANSDLVIGGWWKGGINSLDGKIDEVRLYKRALTDCEIEKLAESFK